MLIPPGSTIKLISIEYEITDDPYTQPDYIGTFSDTWQKNAIRTKDGQWFISEINQWSNWRELWKNVDEAEKSALIKKHGSLKSLTYHYALDDLKRMTAFYNDQWSYVFLDMTATLEISINGLTFISKISDSLGGIESDSLISEYVTDMHKSLTNQLKTIFPIDQIEKAGLVELAKR